jgi:transposase InsO family protein
VVGCAIGRRVDARLAPAAPTAAIESRQTPEGCIHHSDRGSQYAAQDYRAELETHGLEGSMGRRGNPYDNAKAKSFMKTLKVEEVYLMAYETFEDVAASLSRFIGIRERSGAVDCCRPRRRYHNQNESVKDYLSGLKITVSVVRCRPWAPLPDGRAASGATMGRQGRKACLSA